MARKRTSKRRSSKKSAPSPRILPAIKDFVGGISVDRRIDIGGVALVLLGALTLLALFSSQPGGLGDFWLSILRRALGWGVYLFPLGLLMLGLWLVLRNAERVPPFQPQRILGVGLLFLAFLAWLQAFTFAENEAASRALADSGLGGGNLGAALLLGLQSGLGAAGAIILLSALTLVALALTLNVSVVSLFSWLGPLRDRLEERWAERGAEAQDAYTPYQTSAAVEASRPSDGPVEDAAEPGGKEAQGEGEQLLEELLSEEDQYSMPLWKLPAVADMLDPGDEVAYDQDLDRQRAAIIEDTLASFGAPATVVEINRGPAITQFGVEPDYVESRSGRTRVRVSKITGLADDLALAMAASRIRMEAPVPGKGYIGVEVPNEQIGVVALRDVIESDAFKRLQSPLRFALGEDVGGHAVAADLAAMPHLLVAGATGSGKSVAVNALISCMLINNTPETLRFIMIDPKRVELTGYNGVPHLLTPVVVEIDRVVGILQWVTHEMDKRYQRFAKVGARHIIDFNQRQQESGQEILPYLVVIIDELADLMMVAPDQTEKLITRTAQLARATGIHLVIATQRPSVDVVTGLIKANFPARISFAVASATDSRVILDQSGAERLLGRGDMLFQPPDAPAPLRLQGVYVAENEIFRLVNYWRAFAGTAERARPGRERHAARPSDAPPDGVPLKQIPIWEEVEEIQEQEEQDELFEEAVDLVRRRGRASISMLQRRMRIGYTRSARIIEMMEQRGIISPPQGGAHHREILDYGESAAPPVGE